MTRLGARVMTAALVVAVAAGLWWLIKPSTHFVPTKSAISSYETTSVHPRDLKLRSSTLGSSDKGLRAVVVRESVSPWSSQWTTKSLSATVAHRPPRESSAR